MALCKEMTKRHKLKLLTLSFIAVGALLFVWLLHGSLNINDKQENSAWAACDLSDMPAGSVKECRWVSAYRRNEKDIQSIDAYTNLLSDPNSLLSEQPNSAQNKWRSESQEYFLFYAYAPNRGCSVKLRQPGTFTWSHEERKALSELSYFTESCEGRTWDASGRLYRRKGFPKELNLKVPAVKWVSPTSVLVYSN